jgi:hypothetical protein
VFGVPAPTSGLARITIRAPRRLDLAIPRQVPLAEMLPRWCWALERNDPKTLAATGGWMLRRSDGAPLSGDGALAAQGVGDGDVLYLVPRKPGWPEPAYDDVVEEIVVGARGRGRMWDAAISCLVALIAAGIVLATGLVILVAAPFGTQPALIAVAVASADVHRWHPGLAGCQGRASRCYRRGLGRRVRGDRVRTFRRLATRRGWVLVAGSTLLFFSIVGALAVGYGLPYSWPGSPPAGSGFLPAGSPLAWACVGRPPSLL